MVNNKPWRIRFWEKVNFGDEHWLWTGSVDTSGYGLFRLGSTQKAHRVGYYLHYGKWPKNYALHYCDIRRCVRGLCLYDGTPQDNVNDRENRNRSNRRFGQNHGMSKLTSAQVTVIKEQLLYGEEQKELARIYGVSTTVINRIAKGKAWRHL